MVLPANKKHDGWRYQVVIVIRDNGSEEYSFCEIYLDKDGKLKGWTENLHIAAVGNDLDDLIGSLELMISDARQWKPVLAEDLKLGMVFEKADNFVSM
ncbi:MAG: hypothetical protein FWC70_07960 [Defluviitaleaceae bacterium]|nr:hypothetical protein [Defluviitaleaceae bacterium]